MSKYLFVSLWIVAIIFGAVIGYEATQEAPEDCKLPSVEQTYMPGFEDHIMPCSYPQRVVSDLILIGFAPLFLWPLSLLLFFYFIASLIHHRSLRRIDYRPVVVGFSFMILAWFVFLAVDATYGSWP